ncbi:constitutive coactivator of peroxisome proliferator-activated receptor gamma isoform X3 [Scyliorhinus canicula]|nr:constitutive coactivator of peroxisome proliferator-activated receptor gamma isoform X2 [Scyliorhinus canicula]XP_038671736.1 constitutive coactivator of peroxisome proliferator-activated receptor gamma isoform X3 [Scyliorhinus canicula]
MGVKGLQGFVDHACPQASMWVNLKEMAKQHQHSHPESPPVLVVDAMACLRSWYTPEAWVHGGQWREYMRSLNTFVDAFSAIDIKLVFFFDGVIEQKKRHVWIKRRLRNNTEIANIFQFIKANGCQPGRNMFCIPSGLATFTRFALKSMGLDTISSLKEADYEIANYARLNGCMAILSQDTDYLIYDTVPYLSVNKLQLGKLTTVMYSRESLCRILCLQQTDLPLLACLLSNDVVPEQAVEGLKQQCLARYLPSDSRARQRKEVVAAVAHYISGISRSHDGLREVERNIQHTSRESLLEVGVRFYLLSGQDSPWLPKSGTPPGTDQHENATGPLQSILQFAKEKHIKAESSTVYKVLNAREVDCSNTLEDELDTELPGQAIVYRPARQCIYGILLTERNGQLGAAKSCPTVKEWFVYPGNRLQQPDLVPALLPELPGGTPDLQTLWLTEGVEVQKLRYCTFLACFGLQDFAEELLPLEPPTAVALCCLLIYVTLQASQICQEDLDAYLAQAVCIRDKPTDHLAQIQVPCVDSRAVHLASLFVRGLSVLVSANSACGFPFKMVDLMPWEVFDGKLFHTKYLQSHNGCTMEDLLEKKDVLLQEFQKLKSLINSICVRKNRSIQSNPRPWVAALENWERPGARGRGGSHHMAQCEQRPHTSPFPSHHQGYQGRYPQPGPANRAQTGRGSRPGRYNRRPQLYPR